MAGFDEGAVYYRDVGVNFDHEQDNRVVQNRHTIKAKFCEFLRNFERPAADISEDLKLYSDALSGANSDKKYLRVNLQDVVAFDSALGDYLEDDPAQCLPLLEAAALDVLRSVHDRAEQDASKFDSIQVLITTSKPFGPASIRDLKSDWVSKLVLIPGIVTAASKPKHKATTITVMCKTCKNTKTVVCKPGMGGAVLPSYCDLNNVPGTEECGRESFVMLPNKSTYVDSQTLKLQERPEDVPAGELPRTMMLALDRTLVGKISPGTRVTAIGIYSIFQHGGDGKKSKDKSAVAIRQPYLRVVGFKEDVEETAHRTNFPPDEVQRFREFAASADVHERLFSSIAPQIFGHENIKKAVACLMFGGSRKCMPDGTYRRGDTNVLLIGDPSTAKSQFLKFVVKTAPIAVYTSGKGSSAAGLTASVIRDPQTNEFYLEGGAMVLADNGVVCIDEFDKMRPEDRVAIHEAMEQQTISIAKAGITTMLKSRTSVLAAANPPSGRYDDLKTADENMDLQTTILSRFDLIFIVKDERTMARDQQIARHVLDVHRLAGNKLAETNTEEAEADRFLKRYLEYARANCSPRLSEEAADLLVNEYVQLRSEARKTESAAVPITVRQLEAVVRISESLARMQLLAVATEAHVRMAIDLFNASTMDALRSGLVEPSFTDEQRAELYSCEAQIKRRVAIGSYVSERKLVDELARVGLHESLVRRAIISLTCAKELEYRKERRLIHRLK